VTFDTRDSACLLDELFQNGLGAKEFFGNGPHRPADWFMDAVSMSHVR